jgi:hypothetical protein
MFGGVIVFILCLCGKCATGDQSPTVRTPLIEESIQPSSKQPNVLEKQVKPKPTKTKVKNIYYDNCDDAWKDGAAPISKGQPGYRKGLDRNSDGIACEL